MNSPTWPANSRLLVTGASGFVGSAFLDRVARETPLLPVLALGGARSGSGQSIPVHSIDILSRALEPAVQAFEPTHILHLAAKSSVAASHGLRLETMDVSVVGAMNLTDAVRNHAPHARVVFASSGEIYGRAFTSPDPLDELSPVSPMSPYARAKLAAELVLQDRLGDRATLAIMRPLNHTGPGQDDRFVVPAFARQIAEAEAGIRAPVLQVGNLEARRDFLSVSDVVDAYWRVLAMDAPVGSVDVFNVTAEHLRSIREILDDLCGMSVLSFRIEMDPLKLRPADVAETALSSAKLRRETGWQPTRPWANTLSEVLHKARAGVGTA